MRYRYYTADVFTDRLFGGNQLAVFPRANGLQAGLMQQIARELNLSETAFVFPAENPAHTRRLRIFTPRAELPFAGHPTLGTAHVLATIGELVLADERTVIVLEEEVGPVRVAVRTVEGRPVFAQLSAARMPEAGPEPPPPEALAGLLSLTVADLAGAPLGAEAVSTGVPFLFVPVRDASVLGRVRLQGAKWEELLSSYWAPHVYCFALTPSADGPDVRARMFAPAMGIEEDAATGAAAAALAGYLGRRDATREGTLRWTIAQGVEMGRPSRLEVEADKADGEIVAVRLGGSSVLVGEGVIDIPDELAA